MSTITRAGPAQALRARMGYVFQEAALLNSLSAGDNVALPLRETTQTCPTARSVEKCAAPSSRSCKRARRLRQAAQRAFRRHEEARRASPAP
jgi:ABC-type lipoprotein export system ATPase subunit